YFKGSKPERWGNNIFKDTASDFALSYNYFGAGWDSMTEYTTRTMTCIGDFSGDGVPGKEEVDMLQKYFAGRPVSLNVTNEKILQVIDLNDDGKITRKDAMILARHAAGWEDYKYLSSFRGH
ncbi:MAG: hypothetical protein IKB22_00665, partial [Lentisphaeria bacterium]|nr:hypothetical protein [Lentisphaeria bacterium]